MNKYYKTENTNKHNPIRTSIILCWASLMVCLISKLFFHDMFSCNCLSPGINFICDLMDTNIIIKTVIVFVMNFILLTPYTLSLYKKKWFSSNFQALLFLTFLIVNSILKSSFSDNILTFSAEIIFFIVYPTLYILYENFINNKTKKQMIKSCLRPIIFYVILQAFLLTSFFIRDTPVQIKMLENIFMSFIYSLDVFIIVILYYLYGIKRR